MLPTDIHFCTEQTTFCDCQISNSNSSVQTTCWHFSASRFLCFHVSLRRMKTLFPCQRHVFFALTLPWWPLLARLLRTVDGCTWIQLVLPVLSWCTSGHFPISTGNVPLMCFASAALSYPGWPLHLHPTKSQNVLQESLLQLILLWRQRVVTQNIDVTWIFFVH